MHIHIHILYSFAFIISTHAHACICICIHTHTYVCYRERKREIGPTEGKALALGLAVIVLIRRLNGEALPFLLRVPSPLTSAPITSQFQNPIFSLPHLPSLSLPQWIHFSFASIRKTCLKKILVVLWGWRKAQEEPMVLWHVDAGLIWDAGDVKGGDVAMQFSACGGALTWTETACRGLHRIGDCHVMRCGDVLACAGGWGEVVGPSLFYFELDALFKCAKEENRYQLGK